MHTVLKIYFWNCDAIRNFWRSSVLNVGHKWCKSNPSPPADWCPSSPQAMAALEKHDVTWYGIFPWSVGVSCRRFVPSQPLGHPQPTHCGGQSKNREGLDAAQALLRNSWSTAVLSTLGWSRIYSTALYGLPWRKWTPSQPSRLQQFIPDSLQAFWFFFFKVISCHSLWFFYYSASF